MLMGLLISAPGASLSAGVPGSLLGALAPAGSPLPRTPAGVFAPSAPINRELFPSTPPTLFFNKEQYYEHFKVCCINPNFFSLFYFLSFFLTDFFQILFYPLQFLKNIRESLLPPILL